MDDRMWTTEDAETISDDDARALRYEQMRRRLEDITRIERENRATQAAVDWGRSVARVRDERARRIRAEYPEPPRNEIHEEMLERFKSWTEEKKPFKKKDAILKPLPDELFELD